MEDSELESLAIKEIIEELELKKQLELATQQPQERKIRPNSRFLDRTIKNVINHNNRQLADERRNSNIKLQELNRRRRRLQSKLRSRSWSHEQRPNRRRSPRPKEYERRNNYGDNNLETEIEPPPPFYEGIPINLAAIFFNNLSQTLLHKTKKKVPKKKKRKKEKSKKDVLTIDLTKKKRKSKKLVKSKKRVKTKTTKKRKRKRSPSTSSSSSSTSSSSSLRSSFSVSSSNSNNSSLKIICDSSKKISLKESKRNEGSSSLIDLT